MKGIKAMEKILECVPNFSEGRDRKIVEQIVDPFRKTDGVKLLDFQTDEDHNRSVVTVVGNPDALKQAVVESMGIAIDLIDMRTHSGQHPSRRDAQIPQPMAPYSHADAQKAPGFKDSRSAQPAR